MQVNSINLLLPPSIKPPFFLNSLILILLTQGMNYLDNDPKVTNKIDECLNRKF